MSASTTSEDNYTILAVMIPNYMNVSADNMRCDVNFNLEEKLSPLLTLQSTHVKPLGFAPNAFKMGARAFDVSFNSAGDLFIHMLKSTHQTSLSSVEIATVRVREIIKFLLDTYKIQSQFVMVFPTINASVKLSFNL